MRQFWADEPLLAIDTETTGVDPYTDRIVQIAAVEVFPDGTTGATYTALVDPGVPIPEGATAIHGITTDRARADGIDPAKAIDAVAEMIWEHGSLRALVGFNMAYDWTLLNVEAQRHGCEWPCITPILDPFLLDKRYDRYRKGSRKLTAVAAHYGVPLGDDAHGALADATAAGQVTWRMVAKFPHLAEAHLSWLFLEQVRGNEEQRESFIDYMRRSKDPTFDKPPGWPLIAAPEPRTAAAAAQPAPTQGVLTEVRPPRSDSGDDQAHGAPGPVVPDQAGERVSAGLPPAPGDRGVTKRDVAMFAAKAFAAAGEAAPPRQKTKTIDRLRYALTHAITNGRATSLDQLDGREMNAVATWCVDIDQGRVTYEYDDLGVTFTLVATGEPRCVLWADFEADDAA